MPTALQLLVTSGSPGGELACPQRSSISHLERLLFSQKHTHLPALLAMPAEFTAAPSCGKSWVGASKRDPHKGSNSSDTTWLLASTAQVNIPAGDWQRLAAEAHQGRGPGWTAGREGTVNVGKGKLFCFWVQKRRRASCLRHNYRSRKKLRLRTLTNDSHSLFRLSACTVSTTQFGRFCLRGAVLIPSAASRSSIRLRHALP